MRNPALFVESSNRFGAGFLSARGMDRTEGDFIIHFAQHSLQNLTTKLLELAKGKAGKPFDERLLPVSTLAIGQTGQCKDGARIASAN